MKLQYDEMMKSVALVWCWWSERNKANRGENRLALNNLQFTVNMYATEWKEVLMKKPKQSIDRIHTWEAPQADWVLINSDGSFLSNQNRGGWGAIGRDAMEIWCLPQQDQ
jgi:hypothetical protein